MSILYEKHAAYPESILIRKFEGSVEVDDIIASWEYLFSQNLLNEKVKGVINDISDCNLHMNMDSFQKLISYLKGHEAFTWIKLAVICLDPEKIVFPMIGETKVKEIGIKAFTTIGAAESWILTK